MGRAVSLAVVVDIHVTGFDCQEEDGVMIAYKLEMRCKKGCVEKEVRGQRVFDYPLSDVVIFRKCTSVLALVEIKRVSFHITIIGAGDGVLPQGSELGVEICGREGCAVSFETHSANEGVNDGSAICAPRFLTECGRRWHEYHRKTVNRETVI